MVEIVDKSRVDKQLTKEFFKKHWGSPKMVISSGTYKCDELDGFVALNESGQIVGLLTYIIHKNVFEIISLDSILENIGIGTELLNKAEKRAYILKVQHVKVTTTNDNIKALSFYQKRGYRLKEILSNAVAKARDLKPEIPFVADNGIPIRDEIVLRKVIKKSQKKFQTNEKITYDTNDHELCVSKFLSLVNAVWPGEYHEQFTKEALQKTLNITAWVDDELVGCVRILTDGYFFGTITEILVSPDYQGRKIGKHLMELTWEQSPTSLFIGAQPGKEPFFEKLGYTKSIQSFQKKKERK